MVTKEQLQKQCQINAEAIERYKNQINDWSDTDEKRRARFSKVLRKIDRYDDRFSSMISYSGEPKSLSWEEIFAEVGKLLMCNYSEEWQKQVRQDIETLRSRIDESKLP